MELDKLNENEKINMFMIIFYYNIDRKQIILLYLYIKNYEEM